MREQPIKHNIKINIEAERDFAKIYEERFEEDVLL